MKTVIVGAVALLVGLFVGGWGPRAELRRVKKELAEAQETAKRASSSAALPLALGMGSLMSARERAQAVPRFLSPDGGARAGDEDGQRSDERRGPRRSLFADGGALSFEAMKTAADVRAAQFRSAFLDEANLSGERQTSFDATIDNMNKEFAQAANELAQTLRERGQKVRPRDMADIGAKLLDIYRRADDAFVAGLDDRAKQVQARTQFDVLTQIDVAAFRQLAEAMETLGVVDPGGRP